MLDVSTYPVISLSGNKTMKDPGLSPPPPRATYPVISLAGNKTMKDPGLARPPDFW